jgi:hypothetical protein
MVRAPKVESYWNRKVWHNRGWTFQERAVSRRSLVFTNETVYWQCKCNTWHENRPAGPDGILGTNLERRPVPSGASDDWPSYTLKIHPWPNLEQYFNLVRGFNGRRLGFESDARNAFTAITSALSYTFKGGFLFGIPVFFFDIGLLWSRVGFPLKRREGFPSWSWLGWSGPTDLPLVITEVWHPLRDDSDNCVEVWPLSEWYTARDDGSSSALIQNNHHKYTIIPFRPELPLTDGWTSISVEDNKYGESKKRDHKKYSHTKFPGKTFGHPFPDFPPLRDTELLSSTLKFSSQSCILVLGKSSLALDAPEDRTTYLMTGLTDYRGLWAGVIDSLFAEDSEYTHGQACEVIAISRGRALRRTENRKFNYHWQPFDEMRTHPETSQLAVYEFYNVLWIERNNGLAYRKAVGRIWAPAWERQKLIDEDIILA